MDKNNKGKYIFTKNLKFKTVAFIFALLLLFLCRGVWRSLILPYSYQIAYGPKLEEVYKTEISKLETTLKELGMTQPKKESSACYLSWASKFSEEIQCAISPTIPDVPYKQNTVIQKADNAQRFDEAFSKNGWKANITNQDTFVEYFDKLLKDEPRNNVQYYKHIGDYTCNFTMVDVSYSANVSKEFFVTQLGCYRFYNFLGNPYK